MKPEKEASAGGRASSEESRGDYLGFVAHEVRNPLSTALWSAELLARMAPEERGGARGEKLTAMCLRSLGRVRQLVEDHFLSERLDAHGITMRAEPVPLRGLLDEVAGRRALELVDPVLDVAPDVVVNADRTLLDRAVEALLGAAGRDGGAVRVTARAVAGRLELRFEGAPYAPSSLEDPRKGVQGDPKGRSLSLPMARRIAATLGGSLAVEGGGLVLSLPSEAADYASEPGPGPTAHP
ncbi:MAG TPA: HAMP domain-containing sensor histidine kinase [Anaeromyxobacter sp.]|nr:HAMP domain-containing sensor histidine kinase [Anaeromyxobacter sp.]